MRTYEKEWTPPERVAHISWRLERAFFGKYRHWHSCRIEELKARRKAFAIQGKLLK